MVLSGLRFCHCRDIRKVRLSFDIGVVIHWVDDICLFDVALIVSDGSLLCSYLLYREVYRFG